LADGLNKGFRLGPVEVKPADCVVVADGQVKRVEPKVMDVLLALAGSGGGTHIKHIQEIDLMQRMVDGNDKQVSGMLGSGSTQRRMNARGLGNRFAVLSASFLLCPHCIRAVLEQCRCSV